MRFAFPRRSQKTQKGGLRSAHSGRLVGNPEVVAESSSMRRPIPVKSFFALFHNFLPFTNFFRSAKPPLSPPFHPHS